jgi:hypothetical protein
MHRMPGFSVAQYCLKFKNPLKLLLILTAALITMSYILYSAKGIEPVSSYKCIPNGAFKQWDKQDYLMRFAFARQNDWRVGMLNRIADPASNVAIRPNSVEATDLALIQECQSEALSQAIMISGPRYMLYYVNKPGLDLFLSRHPHFFYAEYLKAYEAFSDSHYDNHDKYAQMWLKRALDDAPTALAGCIYRDAGVRHGGTILVNGYPQPSPAAALDLEVSGLDGKIVTIHYPYAKCDDSGCYYVPILSAPFKIKYCMDESDPGYCDGQTSVSEILPARRNDDAWFYPDKRICALPPIVYKQPILWDKPYDEMKQQNPPAIGESSLTLSWAKVPGAKTYRAAIGWWQFGDREISSCGSSEPTIREPHFSKDGAPENFIVLTKDNGGLPSYRNIEYGFFVVAYDEYGVKISNSMGCYITVKNGSVWEDRKRSPFDTR